MSRPDPIEYAERLYQAIRAANFSPFSFLAFGNAIKDGVAMRNMPRVAVEPFMRIVGEMLDLEEESSAGDSVFEADVLSAEAQRKVSPSPAAAMNVAPEAPPVASTATAAAGPTTEPAPPVESVASPEPPTGDRRRNGKRAPDRTP